MALRGPVRRPAAGRGRRAPRDPVGRGRRWTRAPASSTSRPAPAPRTSSCHASTTCRCSRRWTSRAGSTTTTAGCTGCPRSRRPSRSSATSRSSGRLVEAGLYEHRYPECWRCHTPLIFRIADDWFISVRDLRQPMRDANATVEWVPEYMGKRMDDWLAQHGRLEHLPAPLLRAAAALLPVRVRAPERDRVEGGCSSERAVERLDELDELRRPWIDRVPMRCEAVRRAGRADLEVGDVWLDAGIVPFSTLGWQNDTWVEGGNAHGRGARADGRRPARPRVLGAVVPRRLGHRDARADPALVLLAALHVGRARRAARRSSACSATRRCSTRRAGRCTARGGT